VAVTTEVFVGAVVSIVTERPDDETDALPAVSVAVAVKL
jgi:hypothetical protein